METGKFSAWKLESSVLGVVNALVPQERCLPQARSSTCSPAYHPHPLTVGPWLQTEPAPAHRKAPLCPSQQEDPPRAAPQPIPTDKELQRMTCFSHTRAAVCPVPVGHSGACPSHLPVSHALLCSPSSQSLDLFWTLKIGQAPSLHSGARGRSKAPSPSGAKGPPVLGKEAGWA